ncbi:MAG UNVERIFIED_CONTAM: mechanosensitive ion channel family protein [Rickettsiaceae bacterium]|jgi:miniconductance mechanosensitive channel
MFDILGFFANQKLLLLVIIMTLAFYPILLIIKRVIHAALRKTLKAQHQQYAEILQKNNIYSYLIQSSVALYLMFWQEIFNKTDLISDPLVQSIDIIIVIYTTFCITFLILSIINSSVDIYKSKNLHQKTSISLHADIFKIFIVACAILVIISHILHISISVLFTSIGALAAFLTFIFKDTLLGLLASLQLTLQDIIKVGDWVTIPGHNADGTIEKITITCVNIRNFDNTISTIPTATLLATTIINSRKMHESGGRRIKRSITIDMDGIKICSKEDMKRYKNSDETKNFILDFYKMHNESEPITNLALFRNYVLYYLEHHKLIHKQNFVCLVRHLEATCNGVPIEVYAYTKDTSWVKYEEIQSSIFEHIFGILPIFKLRAYQFPDK